jgi:putative endopeptidase
MPKAFFAAAAAVVLALALRADVDPSNFDLSVKPQDDFYHYVNGTWLKNNPIPADLATWGSFAELDERNRANLRLLCEHAAAKADAAGVEKMVGDFFASGMDEATINARGVKPLQEELDHIAAIKTPADLLGTLAYLHTHSIPAAFYFGSAPDEKQSDRELAELSQSGLGLPERGYYFNDDEKSQKLRQQYVAHVATMLSLLGEPHDSAAVSAQAVMALETKLALNSLSRVQLRDPYLSYHKMTVAAVAAATPGIDFKAYFAARGAPPFAEVNLAHPDFFKGLEPLLRSVPIADWQAYLRWHVAHDAAPYLSLPLQQENFRFYGTILAGTEKMRDRWKRVVAAVDTHIGEALGQLYVAAYYPPEAKARMEKLVSDLRASLRDRLSVITWMDAPTRARALEKLDAFGVKIGYPSKWRDYSSVKVTRDDYYGNIRRAEMFEVARRLKRIGQPVDREEWGMTPPTVNAYYRPTSNEIVFPAGILQPPFFDFKADDALNYGAIGAVIGHEMTHGFDDQGAKYDPRGNLNNWWSAESAKMFKERTTAIVKQFDGYSPLEGLHVNGELTQGENIADLGGLKVAYGALQKALAGKTQDPIGGFTPQQRFFLGWATIWRTNIRPETLRLRINTDPHAPAQYRVNGPLSNLDEFARAFAVPAGAPMHRPEAEHVDIW